jgi:hypothetical protein
VEVEAVEQVALEAVEVDSSRKMGLEVTSAMS